MTYDQKRMAVLNAMPIGQPMRSWDIFKTLPDEISQDDFVSMLFDSVDRQYVRKVTAHGQTTFTRLK